MRKIRFWNINQNTLWYATARLVSVADAQPVSLDAFRGTTSTGAAAINSSCAVLKPSGVERNFETTICKPAASQRRSKFSPVKGRRSSIHGRLGK